MTPFATTPVGTAIELRHLRHPSRIGTTQRCYHVEPAVISDYGVATAVVAIPGAHHIYLYPADHDGEVADYTAEIAVVEGTEPDDALASLGYTVAA